MTSLLVFSVFLALPYSIKSWDLAVATMEEIELVSSEGVLNVTIAAQLHGIRDVTWDPVQSHVYLTDTSHEKYSVFRVLAPRDSDDPSAKVEPVVTKLAHDVLNLAFDPVLSVLFWTTSGRTRSISWMQIPTPSEGGPLIPGPGSILHSFQKEVPHGIVVDSCRRYIFWTNIDYNNPSIDRSNIDGQNKTRIIGSDIVTPNAITIDVRNQLIYWTDVREMEFFHIEQANLDGGDRKLIFRGRSKVPTSIAIGFDHIYFTDRNNVFAVGLNDTAMLNVISYNKKYSVEPKAVMTSDTKYFTYTDKDTCLFVKPKKVDSPLVDTAFTASQTIITPEGVHVISAEIVDGDSNSKGEAGCHNNGVSVNGTCVCKEGYHGARCELYLACHNYCVRGNCEVDVTGAATCSCPNQYRGRRCEIDSCAGLCHNGGTCVTIDEAQTHCECAPGYHGARCEESEFLCRAYCLLRNDVNRFQIEEPSSCSCSKYEEESRESSSKSREFSHHSLHSEETETSQVNIDLDNGTESLTITSHEDETSSRTVTSIVTGLGVICALLVMTVLYLSMRIHKLSKRPRIKKRIIVNKTTPLTARPQSDSCEITIENCCNMNICETPCFEPEFRTPIVKSQHKSVEKRTLLDDMEDSNGGDFSS